MMNQGKLTGIAFLVISSFCARLLVCFCFKFVFVLFVCVRVFVCDVCVYVCYCCLVRWLIAFVVVS